MKPGPTPSQTVGPFFRIGLERLFCDDLVPPGYDGLAITLSGKVLDADGEAVPDAVLEIWQADHFGRYVAPDESAAGEASSTFRGWGRIPTDSLGNFRLRTIKPGAVRGLRNTVQAPHLNVTIFMRGLLRHLFTRMYFDGEPENRNDPVLLAVPENRLQTLIATRYPVPEGQYSWNIILQGKEETVFFDW